MTRDSNLLVLAWARYQDQLKGHPMRTKALTACTLAGLSDLIAQNITRAPLNRRRSLAVALYGLLWSGPAGHCWQNLVQQLFKGKNDSNAIALKVMLDNLIFSPVMNLFFMTYMAAVVEGQSWSTSRSCIQVAFPAVQAQAWKLWPIVSFINYTYVPLRLRVLLINIVALFWSTFLNLNVRSAATNKTAP